MEKGDIISTRASETIYLGLELGGRPMSIYLSPGQRRKDVIADSLETAQLRTLVSRGWVRVENVVAVSTNQAASIPLPPAAPVEAPQPVVADDTKVETPPSS